MNRDIASTLAYICLIRDGYSVSIIDPEFALTPWFESESLFLPCILSSSPSSILLGPLRAHQTSSFSKYEMHVYSASSSHSEHVYKAIRPLGQFITLNTSGSSGIPKLVYITISNLLANTCAIIRSLSITDRDSALTILPTHYTYGLSVINMLIYSGGTVFLTNTPTIKSEFLDLINKYQPTLFTGVPYHFEIEKNYPSEIFVLPQLQRLHRLVGSCLPQSNSKS